MSNVFQLHYLNVITPHYLDMANYLKQDLISSNGQDLRINSFIRAILWVDCGQARPIIAEGRYLAAYIGL